MDPKTSAQDVLRCYLCEENVAQMYCNLCPINMCKGCVGEHISDISKRHDVVPLNLKKSTLVYPQCKIHSKDNCETQCEDCNTPVCQKCVTSGQHKRHHFTSLQELFKLKKIGIQKEEIRLRKTVFSAFGEMVSNIKSQLAGIDEKYGKLESDVTKHGEEWHREINFATKKTVDEILEMKNKHKDSLNKHLNDIETLVTNVKQSLSEIEDILQSNDVLKSLSYETIPDEFIKLPAKLNVKLPIFTPQKIQGHFSQLFGSLSLLSITTEEHGYTMKTSQVVSSPFVKPLLDEPNLISSLKTEFDELHHVTCLLDDHLFTGGNETNIKLYNLQGKLLKSIQTKSGNKPCDIAVMRSGDLVYTDPEARTINIVKNKKIQEVIRLHRWEPYYVCSTSSDDLLVTMLSIDTEQSKVVRYSDFSEKQSIQTDNKGRPLYSYTDIKNICENRNLDICVSDFGAQAVVVVNQEGKLRFRYTCPPSTTKETFNPTGITTNSQAQILIADSNNNCIHILDQDGQFLRYIDNCDLILPWGLCMDKNDNLFVAELRGYVKKIQYLL